MTKKLVIYITYIYVCVCIHLYWMTSSNHLILCRPLLSLPPIPPSIRVFSNESALPIRWPKYWSFSFKICPTNEHPGLIFRMNLKVSFYEQSWTSLLYEDWSKTYVLLFILNKTFEKNG